jgi:hypothetical protein
MGVEKMIIETLGKNYTDHQALKVDYSTLPIPAKGVSFTEPNTGHKITRISDVNDVVQLTGLNCGYPWTINGNPREGHYNGYSRHFNVNVTNEYAIAFRTNNHSSLYRLSDNKWMGPLTPNQYHALGEGKEIRWDLSGRPGTEYDIYYHVDQFVYKQNVLSGYKSQVLIATLPSPIKATADQELSNNARYMAVELTNYDNCLIDLYNKTILPGKINQDTSGLDISPSGKWFVMVTSAGTEYATKGFRFYRISDLANNDVSKPLYLPSAITNGVRSVGHNGWGIDYKGNEVLVYQDNRDDWFKAFDPENQIEYKIFNYAELGWDTNQHVSRFININNKGWFLLSTYGVENSTWANNQMFMVEIKNAAEGPRIWKLGSTFCWRYDLAKIDIGGYFSEGFASLDKDAKNIYWASNWFGKDNLELYKMELPVDWYEQLIGTTSGGTTGGGTTDGTTTTVDLNNLINEVLAGNIKLTLTIEKKI